MPMTLAGTRQTSTTPFCKVPGESVCAHRRRTRTTVRPGVAAVHIRVCRRKDRDAAFEASEQRVAVAGGQGKGPQDRGVAGDVVVLLDEPVEEAEELDRVGLANEFLQLEPQVNRVRRVVRLADETSASADSHRIARTSRACASRCE